MRISTGYQFESYQKTIRETYDRYFEMQQEVMTGKRQDLLTRDPVGAGSVIRATSIKANTIQYDKNLRAAKEYLAFSESATSDAYAVLQKAYTIALQGASSSMEASARGALASQIEQMQQQLVNLANTRGASGQYIFAGQMVKTEPFAVSGGALVFSGDNNSVNVEIGPNQVMTVNTPAGNLFTDAYNAMETLRLDLLGNNLTALSNNDIDDIKRQLESFRAVRGQIGTKTQMVQAQGEANLRRTDELAKHIADIEEVDLSEAVQRYQLAETAYSAALQVASNGFKLSLMDFMR